MAKTYYDILGVAQNASAADPNRSVAERGACILRHGAVIPN